MGCSIEELVEEFWSYFVFLLCLLRIGERRRSQGFCLLLLIVIYFLFWGLGMRILSDFSKG